MKTEKIDLYKLHKDDYVTPKKPVLLTIKKAAYLAINGQGAPGGEVFCEKIGALYAMAFTAKMTRKFAGEQDYGVCKLEAQWWGENGEEDFSRTPKEKWQWKLLIRTPDFVTKKELAKAAAAIIEKGKSPTVREVQLESFTEGPCVQMLHVGPYERECETIALMKAHAEANGLKLHGRHHEIYISDPRRVPPERLKTILRHPVRAVNDAMDPEWQGIMSEVRAAEKHAKGKTPNPVLAERERRRR